MPDTGSVQGPRGPAQLTLRGQKSLSPFMGPAPTHPLGT